MTHQSWWSLLSIGLLTAFSPGPALALAVSKTLSHGPRSAAVSSAGNVAGVLACGAVSLTILSLSRSFDILRPIQLLGGSYLALLGMRAAYGTRSEMARESCSALRANPASSFFSGMGVAMLNPKSYVFFGAVLSSFQSETASNATSAINVMSFAACTALSHSVYILGCSRLRGSSMAATMLSRACGAVTSLIGAGMAINAAFVMARL